MLVDEVLMNVDQIGHSPGIGEIGGFFRDGRGLLLEQQNQKQLGVKHGHRGYNNLMVGESLSGRLLRSLLVLEGLALNKQQLKSNDNKEEEHPMNPESNH